MQPIVWGGQGEDGEPDWEFLRRASRPENEVPAVVPFTATLAQTQDVAVFVRGADVYTRGMSFTLSVRVPRRRTDRDLFDVVHGWPAGPGGLALGVELADGRVTSTLTGPGIEVADPAEPVLAESGGGGGGLGVDQEYWLTPVPPEGPLTFVLVWGAMGIAETSVTVDATDVHAAAGRAEVLWPWRPDDGEPGPPPPPQLPTGGWFARHADRLLPGDQRAAD